MSWNRRDFLKIAATGVGTTLASGCDTVSLPYRLIARQLEGAPRTDFDLPEGPDASYDHHFLSRVSFGPRPGDLDRLKRIGYGGYLEEQLHPSLLSDKACDFRSRRFESIFIPTQFLYEFKKHVIVRELAEYTLLRAMYSTRQLYEVMVNFWSDHFNIDTSKMDCVWLKTEDDRNVIRKHALGNFRDLVRASALSPAMLFYLDGRSNRGGTTEEVPNENYARELMELHTMGVHGGYSQEDVMEAARCLTGWTVKRGGSTVFHPDKHDGGSKRLLGVEIEPGLMEKDLDRVLDIIMAHPSTARFISQKLCARFISDDPPSSIVDRVAETFLEEKGEIRPMLRTLFHSEEFWESRGRKVKRPFRFIVSAVRALGADSFGGDRFHDYLTRLGQPLFEFPTPDGYPDVAEPWLGGMLWRWNFAWELPHNEISQTNVDMTSLTQAFPGNQKKILLAKHMLGRDASEQELELLNEAPNNRDAASLLLASPDFQRY